ncbi:2-C-methyl-D-erythritol 4-phosphate cytidylyltransferase [Roseivirga misakiensis]|uniref:2-C-methyl-D-erythritol 4-phosphate cytidylyltransferase n=1 Tax=Roseivirga misakiensis TaxID=1563681 RepID=A0A1E5T4H9_9BACT|nr:2-C-methyl-D-erythritol 4-phosphate cytidylyltransferase [Roseivirga misakiensis]OEK06289.1 2-C-methyl-D-erythritol 4-phosphate cytidylyltransferase [Roseivirga misakiensis]
MQRYAIIVAGGSGKRMQSELPKQFLELAGKPILMHTLEAYYYEQTEIILVLPVKELTQWKSLCIQHNFDIPHRIVEGGTSRFRSVQNGLSAIENTTGLVAIHDGVRPLIKRSIISESYRIADEKGNAITAVAAKDSLREIGDWGNKAVDRSKFQIIQTPQTFRIELIKKAFETKEQDTFTDDASVLENSGERIHLIEGDYSNIKITTPEDLRIAESLLRPN